MKSTRDAYGDALVELGKENKNIVVLDADLSEATKTIKFKNEYPERFFDIGIAEQDLMGTAAGFALSGKVPFASTFAVFATGRAYDQIRNAICYSNLNVKIAATHAGVSVGEDGASHQALEDIALMRALPNMKVYCPSDYNQTKSIIKSAANCKGPMYIRLARPKTEEIYGEEINFELGKSYKHEGGSDALIIATGVAVPESLKAQKNLKEENINVTVLDMYSIKPLDEEAILNEAAKTNLIITVEDHNIIGGLGGAVAEFLSSKMPKKIIRLGINDEFGMSGKWDELLKYYGIDATGIAQTVKKWYNEK